MNIQTKPEYRPTNPKIDLFILTNAGTLKYYASTNYWRTARDAVNWYNKQQGPDGLTFVKGYLDKRNR